ncbi:transcriptional repressor [bacterium]|nr:transcriptional repressor [bacterium]
MGDPQNRFAQMVTRLKQEGHRITPQRLAILRILSVSEGHPSAEMIYDQIKKEFPYTSFATVYKTISLAKALGEVLELEFSQGSNRYDGNRPFPHPHLICTRCKTIMDPDLDAVNYLQDEIVKETGFEVTNHRLDFFGICPDCQKTR